MSSGLYGIAVFAVNLQQHDHESLVTMYINFYAPFLMFSGMVVIPVIHYWRNAKLRQCINAQWIVCKNRAQGKDRRVSNKTLNSRVSRVSKISLSMWVPFTNHSSASVME